MRTPTEECVHVFGEPHRYSRIHSEITCSLCGFEKIIPTPDYLKPEPDWKNFKEVVE